MSDATRETRLHPFGLGPKWRHKKRGTVYQEVGRASLQSVDGAYLGDGCVLVIYRGEDGKLWAREAGEFEDGRFEKIEGQSADHEITPSTGTSAADKGASA